VDRVSFSVAPGETFAIVGESGCGKTTLARMLLRLIEPDEGMILFDEHDLRGASPQEMRAYRRQMQMIFQDPFASLSSRMRVGEIVAEPLAIHEPGLSGTQVLLLLQNLQRELGLTYVLISHSLPVVAQMAAHIAVMRAGRFTEFDPAKLILERPEGEYTKELLAAVPEIPRTGQV
jgi:ABC-type glutathione transport system ATPase component